MSTNRLFNLLVALALAVVIALTVHAGIVTSQTVSTNTAAPAMSQDGVSVLGAPQANQPSVAALLDAPDHNSGPSVHQEWQRAAGNAPGTSFDRQTRDAVQARWLAQHGGTNRTCVLLCGGR